MTHLSWVGRAAALLALSCASACGPASRLGEACATSDDCSELECLAVFEERPEVTTCEQRCTSNADCDAVFGDTNIACLDAVTQIEVAEGSAGLCGRVFSN